MSHSAVTRPDANDGAVQPSSDVAAAASHRMIDESQRTRQTADQAPQGGLDQVGKLFGQISDFFGGGRRDETRVVTQNGRVTEATAPNGVQVNYKYDSSGRPQSIDVLAPNETGMTLTRGENGQWTRSRWTDLGINGLPRYELHRDTVTGVTLEGTNGFSYRAGDTTIFRGNNGSLQESREANGARRVETIAANGSREVQATSPGGSVRYQYDATGQVQEISRNSHDGTSEKLLRGPNGQWTREFGKNGDAVQFTEQLRDVQIDSQHGNSYTYRAGSDNGPLIRQHNNGTREIDYGGRMIRHDYSPEGELTVTHTNTDGQSEQFRNENGTWIRSTYTVSPADHDKPPHLQNRTNETRTELTSFNVDPEGGLQYSHGDRTTTLRRNGIRQDEDVTDDRRTIVTRESNGSVRSIYTRTSDGREEDLRLDQHSGTPALVEGQADNRWSIETAMGARVRDRVTDFVFDPVEGNYSYTRNGQRFMNGRPVQPANQEPPHQDE